LVSFLGGGQSLVFFRPVFNLADSSITVGVFIILFFQKRFFAEQEKKKEDDIASEESDGAKEIIPE